VKRGHECHHARARSAPRQISGLRHRSGHMGPLRRFAKVDAALSGARACLCRVFTRSGGAFAQSARWYR
jgi:hypothetical protein